MYVYFIPVYAQKLGASFLDLGFIGAAYSITYAIGPTFVGYLADRFNRALLYSFGVVVILLVTIGLTLSHYVRDIVIVRALGGFAFAFFWPTSELLVIDIAPKENRVKEMGLYSVSWGTGFLVGPVLGGVVVQSYGFTWLFVTSALLITLAFFVTVLWVVPEHTRRQVHRAVVDFSGSLSIMQALAPWYLLTLCYGVISGVVTTIFPGYANSVGINPTLLGVVFSAYQLARILIYSTVGRLLDFGEIRILLAVSGTLGIGVLSLAVFQSLGGFLIIMVVIGCCFAIIFPVVLSLISNHFPAEKLGTAVGSYETVFGLGAASGPILAGLIAHLTDARWAFALLSLFSVIMFLSVSVGKRTSRKR